MEVAFTGRWYVGWLSAVFFAAALVLACVTAAHAAPGNPDTTFDGDGKTATDFADAFGDSGLDVAVQEDGKVVVAGNVSTGTTGIDFAVARYNPDGSPDLSFGTGGQVVTPVGAYWSNDEAYGVAVRPDGKIVAAGFTNNENTNVDFAAVRYNADGSLDQSFGDGGKVITPVGGGNDYAVDVAVQGTKTILAGRSFKLSHNEFALVRYDDSGDLDTTFDADGKVTTDFSSGTDDYGEDIAVVPGGKLVVAGLTGAVNDPSSNDFAVARYNADGTLDPAFGSGGKAKAHFGVGNDGAYAVGVQEDGKIVVGGKTANGSSEDFALARFRTDGVLDGEFDFDGKMTTDFGGANDWLWDLALQDDGRIVAAGTSGNSSGGANFALARYNPDGSLNASFDHDGRTQTDFFGWSDEGRSVALQEDGGILVAGLAYNPEASNDFAVARYFGGNDATPPRVKPPAQSLLANSTLGATNVPVSLSWSATDLHGEVTGYALQRSTDGGAYAAVSLPSTATTRSLPLAPGHNYRFRVRATDDNGNTSSWQYGPRFALEALQETSPKIGYSPATAWRQQLLNGSYGGQVRYATAAGSTARLAFTGRSVSWVAPKSSTRGRAEVLLDGTRVATVDLSSPTPLARRMVYTANGLDPTATHTLELKVLGTAGRPRVEVDAFVVLR